MSRRLALAVLAAVVAGAAPLRSQSADTGAFTMALTGDSIITRRISVYAEPEHTRLFELIHGADAAFTNLEMLFHDYEPYPMNESGGTLGFGKPRTERGRPVLADADTARKILDDLVRRSAPFGTRITVRDGVGYVDLSSASND